MLRIGDIHINKVQKDSIIARIRDFCSTFPQEEHIVFFGDMVYHFIYDRTSLLALFELFIALYKSGKTVYILAGNHDRIAQEFVYAEAKHSFESMENDGIHFITQPWLTNIEGRDCLFFPFSQLGGYDSLSSSYKELALSEHKGERLSGKANSCLEQHIEERRGSSSKTHELLIFHHWYIVDTVFPGQSARFSWKSPGLDPRFCKMADIRMVSGHIHHPFVRERYLCLGSIWHTSPQEINQQKYLFRYDNVHDNVHAYPCTINPYVTIDIQTSGSVSNDVLATHMQKIQETTLSHLESDVWDIVSHSENISEYTHMTLYLSGEALEYETLAEHIDDALLLGLKDVKIKREKTVLGVLDMHLQDAGMDLQKSIADRKTLLKHYLQKRYPEQSSTYEKILQDIEVIK